MAFPLHFKLTIITQENCGKYPEQVELQALQSWYTIWNKSVNQHSRTNHNIWEMQPFCRHRVSCWTQHKPVWYLHKFNLSSGDHKGQLIDYELYTVKMEEVQHQCTTIFFNCACVCFNFVGWPIPARETRKPFSIDTGLSIVITQAKPNISLPLTKSLGTESPTTTLQYHKHLLKSQFRI